MTCMKQLLNRKKMNNKGMTLIEVMVAVIILSLVGGVLLRSFSMSAVLNRDAKEKQQAMVLAQSIMESFKAYDTDELEKQFGTGVTNGNFKLYKLDSSSTKSCSTDGSGIKTFKLGKINFDGRQYDATAKLSPTTYEANFVNTSDANVYTDAIFRGAESADEFSGIYNLVLSELAALNALPLPTGSSYPLLSHTTVNSRVTTVTIDTSQVSVQVNINLSVNNLEYDAQDPATGTISTEYYSDTLDHTFTYESAYGQTYDNSSTGASLEKVYLYYFPLYRVSKHGNCNTDKLVINNNTAEAKDVYLIKQKSTEFSTTPSLFNSGESLYKLYVEGTGSQVNLYHNIDETFTSGAPDIEIAGSNVSNMGSPWKFSATDTILMYKVEIDIYNTGNATSIHKLEGTVNVK